MKEYSKKATKTPLPNYTQIPNVHLSLMSRLKVPAFLVLMCIDRETFGYHRDRSRPLSLSKICRFTGISRPTVIHAIRELESIGWIKRHQVGQSYAYKTNVPGLHGESIVKEDEAYYG